MMEKAEQQPLRFEEAIEQLEQIVQKLEGGDVPLEQAIELFQEGMKLSRICGEKLDQVEKKVEMLIEKDGEWETKPFHAPQDDIREDSL